MNLSVAIVSIDLRSAWLAIELKKQGFEVSFFDLSGTIPRPAFEDVEGPFGHFLFDAWDSSFSDLLQFEEPFAAQPQGFTVWTEQGPIEYKSALYESKKGKINPLLHRLSYEFNRTRFNLEIRPRKEDLALQNRFTFRHYSRDSMARLRERLKESVHFYDQIRLIDISFEGRGKVTGLEFDGEIKGHRSFDFVVWSLTSEEMQVLPGKLPLYFPPVVPEAKAYVWVGMDFKFDDVPEYQALPEHFFFIQDENLAFNQDNLFVFKKSLAHQQYQVWSLVSSSQQLNETYLSMRAQKIEESLARRCPRLKARLHALPMDLSKSPESRVPSSYVIWKENFPYPKSKFSNLFMNGPDTWTEYSWFENWKNQKNIFQQIMSEYEKRKRKSKPQGPNTLRPKDSSL